MDRTSTRILIEKINCGYERSFSVASEVATEMNLKEELQEIIEMSDSIVFEINDELVSDFPTITLRFEC